MNTFKHILVALDLSDLDKTLIEYANYLAKNFEVEKIHFVHNIKKYEISEVIEQEINDLDLEEAISEELNENVSKIMSEDLNWEVLISDDTYTESLINYICNKNNINTILLGNKNGKKGSGLVGFKLLRMLKCNVFWIPRVKSIDIKSIWVSTDFSVASRKSFVISDLIQGKTKAETTAVHVYNMPMHFSPYVNSSKIETKLENHVVKKFNQYLKKLNYSQNLKTFIISGREANAASRIRQEAKKHKISLLIVADKGGDTLSSLVVGSVTEELFKRDLEMPLFIAKTQY